MVLPRALRGAVNLAAAAFGEAAFRPVYLSGFARDPEPPQRPGVYHWVAEPQDADALPVPSPHLLQGRLDPPYPRTVPVAAAPLPPQPPAPMRTAPMRRLPGAAEPLGG
jgi:hypothetical protein